MYPTIQVVLLAFMIAVAPASDPVVDALGPCDPLEASRDPDLVALTAVEVNEVNDNLPAKAMGMRSGDRLIGLDGLRIVGVGEWQLALYCRVTLPPTARITVLRDSEVVELRPQRLLPQRRLGLRIKLDRKPLREALSQVGFAAPQLPTAETLLAPRAALSLLRWYAHRDPAADTTWIQSLATQVATLSACRWKEAALLPIPQIPDACPDLQRLARFLKNLSLYHAEGERIPDPQHHGESLAYYVLNFPFPRFTLPSLGAFNHPDPRFQKAMQDLRSRASGDYQGFWDTREFQPQLGESPYSLKVRMAVVDPLNFGAWPFSHPNILDRKTRSDLTKELQAHVTAEDGLADVSRLSLLFSSFVTAAERERKGALSEVLPQMIQLRERSPLMGFLSAEVMKEGCRIWAVNNARETLRSYLEAGPLPDSDPPSPLLAYLRRHEASLDFHFFPDEGPLLANQCQQVYWALSRSTSFVDLHKQLASDEVASLPLQQRQELFRQMLDYVGQSCQRADVVALSRLDLPGALTTALGEIAYGHTRFTGDQTWIYPDENVVLQPRHESAMLARLHATQIPWHDSDVTTRMVQELWITCGTPFVGLLLAEDCAAHGRNDLAQELRNRVSESYARFDALAEQQKFNRQTRRWFIEAQLVTSAGIPAMAQQALVLGERHQKLVNEGEGKDSVFLCRALAAITAGQCQEAVEFLCLSFLAPTKEASPIFLTRDGIFTECRWFRTWLLENLVKDPRFTVVERKRLQSAARADLVDDGFAALLGVPRQSLVGDGNAPGANDF